MSGRRYRIPEPPPARGAALPARRRPRRARVGRAAAASGLPAVLALGLLPLGAGGAAIAQAAQRPSWVVCSGYGQCNARGYSSHSYGTRGWRSYWRMTAGDQCTNYAAFVESTVFRAATPGYLLGNAGQWASTALAHGVTVNRIPAVGAVAEWNSGAPGIGSFGHVAVVEQVGPHGRYILISQQHIGSDTNGYEWTRINAGFPASQWQEWPDNFIHFPLPRTAAVGYFSRRSHSFRLRDTLGAGPATEAFAVGFPGVLPLVGDWNGQGREGAGYYNPANGWFHLRDALSAGKAIRTFRFGPPGMIPLAGNWTGGRKDGIGYYDPANGTFHLRNSPSAGRATYVFAFGPPRMVPLAGNWNGARRDGIGYYNPRNGRFHLRNSPSRGTPSYTFRFGPRGMTPVAGEWGA